MEEIDLYSLIERSCEVMIDAQAPDGSFPSGSNGPYGHTETPVRNTSHWVITMLAAHDWFERNEFRTAACEALDYLSSETARPHGHTFQHRLKSGSDRCNGLIGQAWTIESLAVAAQHLKRPELADLAAEVFLLHPFDDEFGIWQPVEIDGSVLAFDRTFNHQLWFAAAGAQLIRFGNKKIQMQIKTFLEGLETLIDVTDQGLVGHMVRPDLKIAPLLQRPHQYRGLLRNYVLHYIRPPKHRRELRKRTIGYHCFNLYALAILKNTHPDHDVWCSRRIGKLLQHSLTDSYLQNVQDNKYSFGYNPTGFEVAYAHHEFELSSETAQRAWVRRQFDRCWNAENGLLEMNSDDPTTLAARIYEATRLPNYSISVSNE